MDQSPDRPEEPLLPPAEMRPAGGRFIGWTLIAAFLLRAGWVFLTWSSDAVFEKYFLLAEKLEGVSWVPGEAFASSPLYIYIVGLLHRVLRLGEPELRLVQALTGTAAILFAWHGARRLCGRFGANIAAASLAIYPALILYDTQPMALVWVNLFNAIALWLLVRAVQDGHRLSAALAGPAFGASLLLRPNLLLLLPVLVLWLAVKGPRPWRRLVFRAQLLGLFALTAAAVVAPVAVMNTRAEGDFVMVTGSGGSSLYGGNNPDASGVMFRAPPGNVKAQLSIDPRTLEQPITPEHLSFRLLAEWAEGRRLSAAEASDFWRREVRGFARREPERFRQLLLNKLRHFFSAWEIHDTHSAYVRGRALALPMRIAFILLWPLGLAGMVICLPRVRRLLPLYGLFGTYLVTAVLFYVTSRLRLPTVLPLAIFAGAGLSHVVQAVRRRRRLPLLVLVLVAVPIGVLAARPTPLIRQIQRQQKATHVHLRVAARRLDQGPKSVPAALREMKRALKTYPPIAQRVLWHLEPYAANPAVRQFVEEVRGMRGELRTEALTPEEERLNGIMSEGFRLFQQRKWQEAADAFTRATKIRPFWHWPYYNRAQAWTRQGKWDLALADLQRAFEFGMKMEPGIDQLYYQMAVAAAKAGAPVLARQYAERALFVNPRLTPARQLLEGLP